MWALVATCIIIYLATRVHTFGDEFSKLAFCSDFELTINTTPWDLWGVCCVFLGEKGQRYIGSTVYYLPFPRTHFYFHQRNSNVTPPESNILQITPKNWPAVWTTMEPWNLDWSGTHWASSMLGESSWIPTIMGTNSSLMKRWRS